MNPVNSPWQDRIDVFRVSYDEVASALRRQDDNFNRTLTTLAFLTAAGVTLYAGVGRHAKLTFDGASLTVPTFFFLAFMVAVVLALVITLSAAVFPSGPLTRPRRASHHGPPPSLTAFELISRNVEWRDYIDVAPDELREMLAKSLHAEARVIADNVAHKSARSREAAAFIQISAASLCLLAIFSAEGVRAETRWWIAAGFALALLLLPLWELFRMLMLGRFFTAIISRLGYGLICVIGVFAAVLLVRAPAIGGRWPAMGYVLGAILTSRLSFMGPSFAQILLPVTTVAGVVLIVVSL